MFLSLSLSSCLSGLPACLPAWLTGWHLINTKGETCKRWFGIKPSQRISRKHLRKPFEYNWYFHYSVYKACQKQHSCMRRLEFHLYLVMWTINLNLFYNGTQWKCNIHIQKCYIKNNRSRTDRFHSPRHYGIAQCC